MTVNPGKLEGSRPFSHINFLLAPSIRPLRKRNETVLSSSRGAACKYRPDRKLASRIPMMHHCGGVSVVSSRQIESAADGKTRKEGGERKERRKNRRTGGKNVNCPSAAATRRRTFSLLLRRRLLPLARTSFREAMETNHVWDTESPFLGRPTRDPSLPGAVYTFLGKPQFLPLFPTLETASVRASVALFTSHNSSHAHPLTS